MAYVFIWVHTALALTGNLLLHKIMLNPLLSSSIVAPVNQRPSACTLSADVVHFLLQTILGQDSQEFMLTCMLQNATICVEHMCTFLHSAFVWALSSIKIMFLERRKLAHSFFTSAVKVWHQIVDEWLLVEDQFSSVLSPFNPFWVS